MTPFRTRTIVRPLVAVALSFFAGCGDALAPEVPCPGLPTRQIDVDLSRITPQFRRAGGNAFVKLTGIPTPEVVAVLNHVGLEAPTGRSDLVSFVSIDVVWGYIGSGDVHDVASVACVTRVEPSADPDGIFLMG